jgi:predicted ATP-grasp superfamily ATP-dependent carboligase
MKIIASVSIEVRVDDTELLDDAKERAIDELIDSLEDWINNNGIPPIISIEYKLPEIDENQQLLN